MTETEIREKLTYYIRGDNIIIAEETFHGYASRALLELHSGLIDGTMNEKQKELFFHIKEFLRDSRFFAEMQSIEDGGLNVTSEMKSKILSLSSATKGHRTVMMTIAGLAAMTSAADFNEATSGLKSTFDRWRAEGLIQ